MAMATEAGRPLTEEERNIRERRRGAITPMPNWQVFNRTRQSLEEKKLYHFQKAQRARDRISMGSINPVHRFNAWYHEGRYNIHDQAEKMAEHGATMHYPHSSADERRYSETMFEQISKDRKARFRMNRERLKEMARETGRLAWAMLKGVAQPRDFLRSLFRTVWNVIAIYVNWILFLCVVAYLLFGLVPTLQYLDTRFHIRETSAWNWAKAHYLINEGATWWERLWDYLYRFPMSLVVDIQTISRTKFKEFQEEALYGIAGYEDPRARKDLGVKLTIPMGQESVFYIGKTYAEKPYVDADLEATTLEGEVIKNVRLSCWFCDYSNTCKEGHILPQSEYAELIETQSIPTTCQSAEKLDKGVWTMKMRALFEFENTANIKLFLVDDQKYNEWARGDSDFDFFSFYKAEKAPRSIYTSGPGEIGIEVRQPIRVGSEFPQRFGISIQKASGWRGEIKKLKSFIIAMPKGLKFREDCVFKPANKKEDICRKICPERSELRQDCITQCEKDRDLYYLTESSIDLANARLDAGGRVLRYSCLLDTSSGSVPQDVDVKKTFILPYINYDFEVEEDYTVYVKELPVTEEGEV